MCVICTEAGELGFVLTGADVAAVRVEGQCKIGVFKVTQSVQVSDARTTDTRRPQQPLLARGLGD